MARGWKCARCSTANGEGTLNCSNCGLIRGGVVVPSSYVPPPVPAPDQASPPPSSLAPVSSTPPNEPWSPMPSPGWNSGTAPASAEAPSPVEPAADGWVAPPAATPLWRRLPLGGVFVLVLLVAGGIGGLIFNASRSSTGEIVKQGDLTAVDLRVGDCFDLKDPSADLIDQVTALPCTAEHEYEMIFTGSLPEGGYPSDDTFTAFLTDHCVPAFGTYIGKAYADSELDIFWLTPTSDAWGDGDRSIQCAAYHPRIHRLTETLKASNR